MSTVCMVIIATLVDTPNNASTGKDHASEGKNAKTSSPMCHATNRASESSRPRTHR